MPSLSWCSIPSSFFVKISSSPFLLFILHFHSFSLCFWGSSCIFVLSQCILRYMCVCLSPDDLFFSSIHWSLHENLSSVILSSCCFQSSPSQSVTSCFQLPLGCNPIHVRLRFFISAISYFQNLSTLKFYWAWSKCFPKLIFVFREIKSVSCSAMSDSLQPYGL